MRHLLSQLYGLAARLRAFLYRRGLLKSHRLGNPVISVGNLTLGGTGKTPLVAFLARTLQKGGRQPVILSRGYKGTTREKVLLVSDGRQPLTTPDLCGDEPYLLSRQLEGVPVVVARDRHLGGQFAEERFPRAVHLLDDGYQHLRLKRNLNILVVDATDPFGGGRLLPAGRLREPLSALGRADSIIITRSHMAPESDHLEATIRRWNRRAPIAYFYHDLVALFDLKNPQHRFRPRDFLGKRVIALAALGQPRVFLHDLEHYQMVLVDQFLFRDHHAFTQSELDRARNRVRKSGAAGIVTTEKDSVRLQSLRCDPGEVFVVEIECKPQDPETYKKQFLEEIQFLPEAR